MEFVVYDVFTDTRFGGNPLAVVFGPGARPQQELQQIAREFNFSETTFVAPPAAGGDARVRIFTPTQEIPFAGHPTIGTARALYDLGRVGSEMVLELGVGPIPVTIAGARARFETRVPLQTWDGPPAQVVARSAGLGVADIRTDRHPPIIASVGLPFAIAEVVPEALARAQPNVEAFRAFAPLWPLATHFDLLIYARAGAQIRARMFAPLDGIPEDPATGSAAAALAAYLGQLDGQSAQFDITQGVEMGRPSQIRATVTVQRGAPVAVTIEGAAVKVMEGRLTLG
jgi:trans-2,3-dihydro-3-hydroxyanthranilate isomerase